MDIDKLIKKVNEWINEDIEHRSATVLVTESVKGSNNKINALCSVEGNENHVRLSLLNAMKMNQCFAADVLLASYSYYRYIYDSKNEGKSRTILKNYN